MRQVDMEFLIPVKSVMKYWVRLDRLDVAWNF